jgi:hypothetical protein
LRRPTAGSTHTLVYASRSPARARMLPRPPG